ncbi:CLUMA_CG019843, isoform A [Clunio marinus]|uniref:CLUMA_CG019843, isoform A n=1 Tax=Clunio marinus TaxID=568069 RepID=A0A1J1J3H5_9DIPT|nr:CLUMA_CG019843, isoform A [Clunio marinus]
MFVSGKSLAEKKVKDLSIDNPNGKLFMHLFPEKVLGFVKFEYTVKVVSGVFSTNKLLDFSTDANIIVLNVSMKLPKTLNESEIIWMVKHAIIYVSFLLQRSE